MRVSGKDLFIEVCHSRIRPLSDANAFVLHRSPAIFGQRSRNDAHPPAASPVQRLGRRVTLYLLELGRGAGLGELLQHQHVLAVLLETHRVGLDVPQDPVKILLVHAQEEAAVLATDDRRRPAEQISSTQRLRRLRLRD